MDELVVLRSGVVDGGRFVSFAQLRDLVRCVRRWRATFGSYDYPEGDAIALRTGRRLADQGLVELGNRFSANRRPRWRPTARGRALGGKWIDHPERSAILSSFTSGPEESPGARRLPAANDGPGARAGRPISQSQPGLP